MKKIIQTKLKLLTLKIQNKMKAAFASILILLFSLTVVAQSDIKESTNSFARYTHSGDIKHLENAKKFIDLAYKTRRDTTRNRNNILRALIYSSIAYADSTQKIKTTMDPIAIVKNSLGKIKIKNRSNYENEINYINQNLTAAYIQRANKHIARKEYDLAYKNFLEVEKIGNSSSYDVLNNLALLAAQAGKNQEAIGYYKAILAEEEKADVSTYLALAKLYKTVDEKQLYLNTLREARLSFKDNKDVLLLLIQAYADNKMYSPIVPIIDEAIQHDPTSVALNYLGGYANENTNNIEKSKKYYERVLELNENNFDANLALGLIYLKEFLNNKEDLEAQYKAQDYLLSANAIQPYALNALQGLALYYETTEDEEQKDRVKILLNQLSNN